MTRKCPFVKIDNVVYVPSPESWLGGWARQRWLERYFGKDFQVRNIGAEGWAELSLDHKVKILTEQGGKFKEIKKKKTKAKSK